MYLARRPALSQLWQQTCCNSVHFRGKIPAGTPSKMAKQYTGSSLLLQSKKGVIGKDLKQVEIFFSEINH
jgi:hypothetical protein